MRYRGVCWQHPYTSLQMNDLHQSFKRLETQFKLNSNCLNKQQEEQNNTISELTSFIEQIIMKHHSAEQRLKNICEQLCTELEDKVADLSLVGTARETMKEEEEQWSNLQANIKKRIDNLILAQAIEVSPEQEPKAPTPVRYQNRQDRVFNVGLNSTANYGVNKLYSSNNQVKQEYIDNISEQYSTFEDYLNKPAPMDDHSAFQSMPQTPEQQQQNYLANSRLSLYEKPKRFKTPPMYKPNLSKMPRSQMYRAAINQQHLDVNIFVNKVLLPTLEYNPDGFIPKKIILNNYFAWKFSTGRKILLSDSGTIQMELTVKIKSLFKKAGHSRKVFKGIVFKKQYEERMNLTDKMKPAWLNDNSPYDGYSHLDPLENRFFKDQVEREAYMKNSQYSTQNDSRYSTINYSIIDDEDDVRYNKYEIN